MNRNSTISISLVFEPMVTSNMTMLDDTLFMGNKTMKNIIWPLQLGKYVA